jgi:neutral ceramidase
MKAGFAKVNISPSAFGANLMGYADRTGPALALHDPLWARAAVLEHDGARIAICVVDLCAIGEDIVRSAREQVARHTPIRRDEVLVAATHTHSAPSDLDPSCWPHGLESLIAQAITEAHARAEPARVGVGWGFLSGHTINRRRFEEPVDPAVFVLRVDATNGTPLGALHSFACHPVVLGPDNREVSGDWPATANRLIERALGGAVAIFAQGSCGDVNPLTARVRQRLVTEPHVRSGSGICYYGLPSAAGRTGFAIGDRTGGTFAEAEVLGSAVAREAIRVHRGIVTAGIDRLWTRQLAVSPGGNAAGQAAPLGAHLFPRAAPGDPVEIMLIGIDPGVVLVGQPGEVFGETGVGLRRDLRSLGVPDALVIGYANGWRGYLPPPSAYVDGGYEVDWAHAAGLSEALQGDVRRVILATIPHPTV